MRFQFKKGKKEGSVTTEQELFFYLQYEELINRIREEGADSRVNPFR